MRIAMIAVLPALAALAAACGSSFPPPHDEYDAAKVDVGKAEAGGAPNVPDAKLHLKLAKDDLDAAKDKIEKDNRLALDLISVARVEAQLALSLAKQQLAEDQARAAQDALAKAKGGQ